MITDPGKFCAGMQRERVGIGALRRIGAVVAGGDDEHDAGIHRPLHRAEQRRARAWTRQARG